MKKTLLFATILVVALLAVAGIAQAQTKTFQFMFVNHVNVQLNFSVDDAYACTANAGMVCYSTIAAGTHDFKAMQGSTVFRHVVATLYENADNPQWIICYSATGSCE
jgi:hypothetical protein